jgi:phosphatidylglycerophosphate synthase
LTLAVLTARTGHAIPDGDADRLAGELTGALRAAGVSAVDRLVPGADEAIRLRELARQARDAGEPLLICADNLVAHGSLLWTLATEPAGRSTVLVAPDPVGDLKEDRGRVVAAPPGGGSVRYLGAMCVAPADLPLLEKAADRPDPLAEMLADGFVPVATRVRLLHAEQVETAEQLSAARAVLDGVNEDAVRLRLAVKEQDDFFTTYAVSTWSPYVTKAAARLRLSPTAVTGLSVLFAVGAALLFWQASRIAMVLGGVLLYLGFVLDCVDGQLARYTRNFDAFGGWLDTMADRAKEYTVYAGLAAGADRIGLPYAWPLAITAILLQTARHMTDTWYGALHDEAAARPAPAATRGVGARLTAASVKAQSQRGSLIYWAKRIVVFPIGERWALISVLAAVTNGRATLAAVVGFGLLAAGYTLALRSLRALSMRVGVLHTVDTARHRDDGPLVRSVLSRIGVGRPLPFAAILTGYALVTTAVLAASVPSDYAWLLALVAVPVLIAGFPGRVRHDGALDWLVPAALRAAEYLVVVAVGLYGGVSWPLVFLLLFTLTLRHYDLTARMEKGAPATGAGRAVLGWDGRVLLLVLAALAGYAAAGTVLLAVLVAGAFLLTAARDWRASR